MAGRRRACGGARRGRVRRGWQADDLPAGHIMPNEAAVFARAEGESPGGDVDEGSAVLLPPPERFALGETRPDAPQATSAFSSDLHPLTGHDDCPVDP